MSTCIYLKCINKIVGIIVVELNMKCMYYIKVGAVVVV